MDAPAGTVKVSADSAEVRPLSAPAATTRGDGSKPLGAASFTRILPVLPGFTFFAVDGRQHEVRVEGPQKGGHAGVQAQHLLDDALQVLHLGQVRRLDLAPVLAQDGHDLFIALLLEEKKKWTLVGARLPRFPS